MKMKIDIPAVVLIVSLLIMPKAAAADVEFQPRFETGVLFYSFEQTPASKIALPRSDGSSGFNFAQEKFEISDNIGFVGGGGTLFIRRLFVDVSGQYAFNGSACTQVSSSGFLETENIFISSEDHYHGQFYRTDMAISAGYTVNSRFSVYAGYKWAAVDLDMTSDGPMGWLDIDNGLASGRFESEAHDKFRYEGPFIGVTHGWQIDHSGFFKGLISAKVALAFLSSKFSIDERSAITYDSINGVEIEPIVETMERIGDIKGDTLGLTLGFDWHGMTAIKNLSYWIGLNGYRYNFDAEDSEAPDVRETAVSFKAGLAYVF